MNLPTYITGTTQTKAYRLLREHVYDVLNEYDLTPSYWSVLGMILQAKDGVRQVEIAQMLHVKAPMITTMAHKLEAMGMIQSVQNQFDARAKLLAVTPLGKKQIRTIELELNQRLSRLLQGLTEADLITYHKVLTTIIHNDDGIRHRS